MSLSQYVYEEILAKQIASQAIQKVKQNTKLYRIVQGKIKDVESEVQQLIAEGWNCQGGIALYQDWFGQAMMLEVNEDNHLH
jgi:hypothetical protein